MSWIEASSSTTRMRLCMRGSRQPASAIIAAAQHDSLMTAPAPRREHNACGPAHSPENVTLGDFRLAVETRPMGLVRRTNPSVREVVVTAHFGSQASVAGRSRVEICVRLIVRPYQRTVNLGTRHCPIGNSQREGMWHPGNITAGESSCEADFLGVAGPDLGFPSASRPAGIRVAPRSGWPGYSVAQ